MGGTSTLGGAGGAAGNEAGSGGEAAEHVVALGVGHSAVCAVISGGALRCWGSSMDGSLGYGNQLLIGDDETPASAGDVPIGAKIASVAVGFAHTCALAVDGTLRCFGYGFDGALGYGNRLTLGDDEPASTGGAVSLDKKVQAVGAGAYHTCALLATGDVRCWGRRGGGQLGLPDSVNDPNTWGGIGDDELPTAAPPLSLGSPVVQLAVGSWHTCVLLGGGRVRCWGSGGRGALGYGSTNDVRDASLAGDVDVGGEVVQLSAGADRTCALLRNGGVRCWGWGSEGALGYGTTQNVGDDETPASVGDVPLGARARQIATGAYHTCALLEDQRVRCWGSQLLLGSQSSEQIGDDEPASEALDVELGGPAITIGVGVSQSCALLEGGAVRCWGYSPGNGYGLGQLIGDDEAPASVGNVQVLSPR